MMSAPGCVAVALLQTNMEGMQHDIHLQTIFLGIIAFVLLAAILVVAIGGLVGLRLIRKAEAMAERMEETIVPLAETTNKMVTQLAPKIHNLTENAEQISFTVRGKVDELGETVSELNKTVKDVNARTRAQVARVDGMVGDALTTAKDVSDTVQENIRRPVQQIASLIAGLKAGLETLVDRSPLFRRGRRTTSTNPYDV
jgi:methyl-accepting chemotaxis protein